MSTVINTNLASLFAQNSLSNAQNNLATSVQRLSSGLRINSAKDDAAGLSIAQNMQGQINIIDAYIQNIRVSEGLQETITTFSGAGSFDRNNGYAHIEYMKQLEAEREAFNARISLYSELASTGRCPVCESEPTIQTDTSKLKELEETLNAVIFQLDSYKGNFISNFESLVSTLELSEINYSSVRDQHKKLGKIKSFSPINQKINIYR